MRNVLSIPKFTIITFSLLAFSIMKASMPSLPENAPANLSVGSVQMYITSSDKSNLFRTSTIPFSKQSESTLIPNTLQIDPSTTFQEIDGFGAAITSSTCYNLLKMKKEDRDKLLNEIFDPVNGMGYSYIRISIGCSDFSLDEYTCCDTPGMEHFAIHELDKRDLFPVLKQILDINPSLKILASPWTCPRWMKVNNLTDLQPFNSWTSGQLNPAFYADYATYFVRFVQEMKKAGFSIDAVTVQNEPLNRGNSASLYMTWQEQAEFVKKALGPQFKKAGLTTKIIVFDHNFNYDKIADQQSYPLKIYSDKEASQFIDGAAYHAYSGNKMEMGRVHEQAPDKNLYFTEMSIGTWNYTFDRDLMWSMREIGIGSLNNYCKAVIVWNLMLDDKRAPNRPKGCTTCFGAVDVDTKDYATLDRKTHYYVIGHLSKVIAPGAKRLKIAGQAQEGLYSVAVRNPDGTYGAVLQNDTKEDLEVAVTDGVHSFRYTIPAKSIISCKWN